MTKKHLPGWCSTPYLYPVNSFCQLSQNESSLSIRLVLAGGRDIRFRWFHTCAEDLTPSVFIVIIKFHSHSPVTGWPTGVLAKVTQRSNTPTRLYVCLFSYHFSSSLSPSPKACLSFSWTYHITLHIVLFERRMDLKKFWSKNCLFLILI